MKSNDILLDDLQVWGIIVIILSICFALIDYWEKKKSKHIEYIIKDRNRNEDDKISEIGSISGETAGYTILSLLLIIVIIITIWYMESKMLSSKLIDRWYESGYVTNFFKGIGAGVLIIGMTAIPTYTLCAIQKLKWKIFCGVIE